MKHSILVIDDRADERASIYERLVSACRANVTVQNPAFSIQLLYANNFWELQDRLTHNSFSAIILDVVLTEWKRADGSSIRATDVLELLNDKIPVALLTSKWDTDEVKEVIRQWPKKKNIGLFIHWDDLEKDELVRERGSIIRILMTLKNMIEEYANVDYSVSIEDDQSIKIVHLSDMQFGGFNGWKLNPVLHYAETIHKKWPTGPDFIAITGDVTERGLPSEFDGALQWLNKLVTEFGWRLPSPRILLVPGNHDVCLPLGASPFLCLPAATSQRAKAPARSEPRQVDFARDGSSFSDLADYAFAPYTRFAVSVTPVEGLPPPEDPDHRHDFENSYCWIEARFRYLGVVFFGLNTARPLNGRKLPGRNVSPVAIEELTKNLNLVTRGCEVQPLMVGLSHHAPVGERHDRAVENPEAFDRLFSDVSRIG